MKTKTTYLFILSSFLLTACYTTKMATQKKNAPEKAIAENKNKIKRNASTSIDEFQTYKVDESVNVPTATSEIVENWKNDKFGLFIHWGPISQLGKPLSHSRHSESHYPGHRPYKPWKEGMLEPEVYDIQYKTFNPVKFDPDYIVKLAKAAGMRYLVFTAKHHAGFSMFDSKVTDYDIMSSPYHKDVLKELEQACRRQNFNFGFYYSPRDWHHPDCDSPNHHDRYIKFFKAQMDELLTNYGSIYEVWFDGLGPGNWGNTSQEIMQKIRKLQPQAMVNNRAGVGADFYTPEQTISQLNNEDAWEACHTITSQWGYNPNVKVKPLKQLLETLLYTWGGGGNMLLNIGPRGDGSLNPVEEERLKQLAKWWQQNGEIAIGNSRGGPYYQENWGVSTKKNNKVYLHVFRWPKSGKLTLPNLSGHQLLDARLLNAKKLTLQKNKQSYIISVSPENRDKIETTIELIFDKDIMDVKPLHVITPLTYHAKLTASQNKKDINNVVDGDAKTTWYADSKQGPIWIEAQFDHPVTIASIVTGRGRRWLIKNIQKLQIPDGKGGWKTVFKWKPKWTTVKFLKKPVTTKKIRLLVEAKWYNLAEFELYPPL